VSDLVRRERTKFSAALLKWFAANARDLPWRRKRTPYTVWISEIMLQQTQVAQARPYYHAFLRQFPNVKHLAAAPLEQVLKAWEGLGYYARARNLHRTACEIVARHNGHFPRDIETVRRLPGIGPYTAAAILSLSFGQPHAVLDGNVLRVLCRLIAYGENPKTTASKKVLQELAQVLLPSQRAGEFNEAMMELGAVVCTPANPRCSDCPVVRFCLAQDLGQQALFPVRVKQKKRPHHQIAAALIWRGEKLLIARRPLQGLLGGLWEFPGGKQESGEALEATAVREAREELGVRIRVRDFYMRVDHQYTHFTITLHAFHADYLGGQPQRLGCADWRWVSIGELARFAFPRANGKIIEKLSSESRPVRQRRVQS
jgi:A/G-specific adenine glycosylase